MNVVGTQTFSPRYIVTIQKTGQEVAETVPVFYPVVLSGSLNEAWRWLGPALCLPGCQWEPGVACGNQNSSPSALRRENAGSPPA